jgi:hypothetical protein
MRCRRARARRRCRHCRHCRGIRRSAAAITRTLRPSFVTRKLRPSFVTRRLRRELLTGTVVRRSLAAAAAATARCGRESMQRLQRLQRRESMQRLKQPLTQDRKHVQQAVLIRLQRSRPRAERCGGHFLGHEGATSEFGVELGKTARRPSERRSERQSMAIRGHHQRAIREAIRGHQRQSEELGAWRIAYSRVPDDI